LLTIKKFELLSALINIAHLALGFELWFALHVCVQVRGIK